MGGHSDSEPAATDPTEHSHWAPLHRLFKKLDLEIEQLYTERHIPEVRARLTKPIIRLSRRGDMTIRQLADQLDVSHSAMSQTVSMLRRDDLVETAKGIDGRTRVVRLTDRGRELVPFLEAEWRATDLAVAELDAEIPYPLARVVSDIEAALARRSFRDRVAAHLEDPAQ